MWRSDRRTLIRLQRRHPGGLRDRKARSPASSRYPLLAGFPGSGSIAALGLLCGLWAIMAWAADPAELESRLDQLRADISRIQSRLDADLANRDELRQELAHSERQVAEADRNLRTTESSLVDTRAGIDEIEARIAAISKEKSDLLKLLGAQLRLAYRQGGQSRLKLLLNQDDPRQLARQMAYHGYLSRARLALLADLAALQDRLHDSRAELTLEMTRLSELERLQSADVRALQIARQERDQAIRRLQDRIDSQAAQLVAMEQDAAELEALIEELARALRDIPMDIEVPSILSLQGQLPLPVKGSLARRFGDVRGGELRWNGWLIGAAAGETVRAIAHGRVAYADWLRGYGMLLILDHGDGVMSLYGHNESLLRQVGDWVALGDGIAIVGQSGGGEPGLYFELRRDGRPENPNAWLIRP